MKGKNTLKLNQETMCAALQVWVKETFAGPHVPRVTQVKINQSTSSSYGGGSDFEVEVESPEKAA